MHWLHTWTHGLLSNTTKHCQNTLRAIFYNVQYSFFNVQYSKMTPVHLTSLFFAYVYFILYIFYIFLPMFILYIFYIFFTVALLLELAFNLIVHAYSDNKRHYILWKIKTPLTSLIADFSISTGDTVKAADRLSFPIGDTGSRGAALTAYRNRHLNNKINKLIIFSGKLPWHVLLICLLPGWILYSTELLIRWDGDQIQPSDQWWKCSETRRSRSASWPGHKQLGCRLRQRKTFPHVE